MATACRHICNYVWILIKLLSFCLGLSGQPIAIVIGIVIVTVLSLAFCCILCTCLCCCIALLVQCILFRIRSISVTGLTGNSMSVHIMRSSVIKIYFHHGITDLNIEQSHRNLDLPIKSNLIQEVCGALAVSTIDDACQTLARADMVESTYSV